MNKIWNFIAKKQEQVLAIFLTVISVVVIILILPAQARFKYEYQKGKAWLNTDLYAPFDFPILKSPQQIEEEKQALKESQVLVFERDESAEKSFFTFVDSVVEGKLEEASWRKAYREFFRNAYAKGVFEEGNTPRFNSQNMAAVEEDQSIKTKDPTQFVGKTNLIADFRNADEMQEGPLAWELLQDQLLPNLIFNKPKTDRLLETKLAQLMPTKGVVRADELIIAEGAVVDDGRYEKLESLRRAYAGSQLENRQVIGIRVGQLILVSGLFVILILFLRAFRPNILIQPNKLALVFFNVIWISIVAFFAVRFHPEYIYLVPFPIVPIALRSFFDTRLALFVHFIAALIAGLLASNSFEFFFVQFVAGVFAIITVTGLHKRAQLFLVTLRITAVYLVVFAGFLLVHEGSIKSEHYIYALLFLGNGLLSLFVYPLIYIFEKVFGLVSDVTLLELSDTNNKLLRKLSQKAPGTFQHSIQVANLAEAASQEVGANTLLLRTAALYHDIGKMANPMYFIENQSTGVNPHDELSFRESARIIISHVQDGVKLAKKHNLPEEIIDFIRTHHGTSRVQYFYKMHIKDFPEDEGQLAEFTYPGPKPFSKETAILMIADSIEAASRSLTTPTVDKLSDLVDKIIAAQMADGQFENASITMREITHIKLIMKQKLRNIYHGRIVYPE